MIYLTYNDLPSGIYNSQVIDVVNYLNGLSNEKVKLISIISIRNYWQNRSKIKRECLNSIVIPMIPKAVNWKWNIIILFFCLVFQPHKKIIARGPFATHLALYLKRIKLCKKIIFDARGAYDSELKEYHVIPEQSIINNIKDLERDSIQLTDYKIAVSNALVKYWRLNYGYKDDNHVIIPCTLSKDFVFEFPEKEEIKKRKNELGYNEDDILFIYSGSSAGWQSLHLVDEMMGDILNNPKTKLIILSNHLDESLNVTKKHPQCVKVLFVEPNKVKDYLIISDYGILYREQSITNKVASPVKYAEYLSCGLKVLISDNLGDYTDFSKNENLIFNRKSITPVSYFEKQKIHDLCMRNFIKEKYKTEYLTLLNI